MARVIRELSAQIAASEGRMMAVINRCKSLFSPNQFVVTFTEDLDSSSNFVLYYMYICYHYLQVREWYSMK